MKILEKLARILNGSSNQFVIKMENLAPLWLRYNNDFTSAPVSDEEEIQENIDSPVVAQKEGGKEERTYPTAQQEIQKANKINHQTVFEPLLQIINDKYSAVFEQYKEVLLKVINIIDKYANVSSVVTYQKDIDKIEYAPSTYDMLAKIQLKEHLVNTAINIVRIVEKKYDPNTPLLPMFVFAALLHDIGKSIEIRKSSNYSSADHPIVSAELANDIIPDNNIAYGWKSELLNAIRNHHDSYTQDNASLVLKEADATSRQIELASLTQYKITSNYDNINWFDPNDFIKNYVAPVINQVDETGKWIAITYKNNVYVETRTLYKLVEKYMYDKNYIDTMFIRLSFYNSAINYIISKLYKANYLRNEAMRSFKVSYVNKFYTLTLIEIPINKIGIMPSELEKRKTIELETFRIL